METGLSGLDEVEPPGDRDAFRAALSAPRPDRLLMAAQALRAGLTVEEVHDSCKFDPWFLRELERIVAAERELAATGLPTEPVALRRIKALGFSDQQLARLTGRRDRMDMISATYKFEVARRDGGKPRLSAPILKPTLQDMLASGTRRSSFGP